MNSRSTNYSKKKTEMPLVTKDDEYGNKTLRLYSWSFRVKDASASCCPLQDRSTITSRRSERAFGHRANNTIFKNIHSFYQHPNQQIRVLTITNTWKVIFK